MYDSIDFLEGQEPANRLQNSHELELAAKAYFDTDGSPELLADRVEAQTEWEGELNEIVHYSRRGVNGRDVLIHILLSDDPGSDHNKIILLNNYFSYIGVKIGTDKSSQY